MASTSRIFVAFAIPEVQKTRLGRLQGLIAPELPNARWVTPEMFHVTLAFLGEVPDLDLNPVCRAVAAACEGVPPFTVNLQSLGAFPDPAKPRVAWVGLTGPDIEGLTTLQTAIAGAVGPGSPIGRRTVTDGLVIASSSVGAQGGAEPGVNIP